MRTQGKGKVNYSTFVYLLFLVYWEHLVSAGNIQPFSSDSTDLKLEAKKKLIFVNTNGF